MTVQEREKRSHGHPLVTESKPNTQVQLPIKKEVAQAEPQAEPQPTTPRAEVEEKLPATASNVPLIALAGILALAIAAVLKAFQKG